MNWVAPIKDEATLHRFEDALRSIDFKYYLLFEIGIGTGMQLQDILQLKVGDVRGAKEYHALIGIQQTELVYHIPEALQAEIAAFTEGKSDDQYLITGYAGTGRPLSREQSYRIFKQAGLMIGLKSIGTQTMRKTFAWRYYHETGDIEYIRKLLNHASANITYRYIGEKPNIQSIYDQLSIDNNRQARQYLLTDKKGLQDIDEIIASLRRVRRQLAKNQPDAFYGRTDSLLTQIKELLQDYDQG